MIVIGKRHDALYFQFAEQVLCLSPRIKHGRQKEQAVVVPLNRHALSSSTDVISTSCCY